jgi:hypothetical protein
MKDQLWNHGRLFQTDEVEDRRLSAFVLLVRKHEWEIEHNVAEAGVQVEILIFELGG